MDNRMKLFKHIHYTEKSSLKENTYLDLKFIAILSILLVWIRNI